jgi:hypothetical protein
MTKQESLIIELLDACIVAERAFRVPARTWSTPRSICCGW